MGYKIDDKFIDDGTDLSPKNARGIEVNGNIKADNLGLVLITEGGQTGWRLYGFNPANYGDIGIKAGDLSFSDNVGATRGATGSYSFATGYNTIASGVYSTAMGRYTIANETASTAMGGYTIASGAHSTAMGLNTTAQSYSSLAIGRFNIIEGTAGSWINTEPLFVVGNGLDGDNCANAFTILKNGNYAHSGGNGSSYNCKTITEEVTVAVGEGNTPVVTTSGNLVPANSMIKAIAFRVTQAPGGGAAVLDIGITGGDLDAYIDGASCDIVDEIGDFYTNGSVGAPIMNRGAATTLTLTTDADVTGTDMKVRVMVWYDDITAPTS